MQNDPSLQENVVMVDEISFFSRFDIVEVVGRVSFIEAAS